MDGTMSLSPASEESYPRLGLVPRQRWARGFRLCARRRGGQVRRLREKLLRLLGLVSRHAGVLGRRLSTWSRGSPCPRSGSTRALVRSQRWYCSQGGKPTRAVSFVRTNSFYTQAVADCLEFIKRNSVPLQDYGSPVPYSCGRRREIDLS